MEPDCIETLAVVNAGPARRATLHGQSYLVANATMIVPGVLPGSDGPLYYPEEEVLSEPTVWNHMPMVVGHPKDDKGAHITARTPATLNEYGIGLVFNTGGESSLQTELWFNEERTRSLVPLVYQDLHAGKPIELSTGLIIDKEPAQPGATFNNIPYTATARNYRPDHLAILVNEKGACSIRDGCGVNVTNNEGEPMKEKLVSWLTTNCTCWKAKGSKDVLNKMDEKRLRQLKDNAIANKLVANAKTVVNAEGEEGEVNGTSIKDLAEFLGVTIDPAGDPVGFIKELTAKIDAVKTKLVGATEAVEEEEEEMTPPSLNTEDEDEEEYVPTGNRTSAVKAAKVVKGKLLTMKQMLSNATPEEQAVWNNAVRVERQGRLALVRKIVGNSGLTDRAKIKKLGDKLMTKSIEELEDTLALQGGDRVNNTRTKTSKSENNDVSIYIGAGGGSDHVTNSADSDDDDDVLPLPTVNFDADPKDDEEDEEEAPRQRQRRAAR